MPAATTCSWLPEAVRDLEALAGASCDALARRLRPAIDRIAKMNGGDGAADAFLRSGSTPFVRLVDAMARDLGVAGDPRVALIGRSTVMGYLYVRLQDDLVDEEVLVDRATVYAMEVALSAHLDLLARADVPASVWRARSHLMTTFAAFSAREYDARGDAGGVPAERAGEKFLGMAVPLVALAALAGRAGIDDALAELVVSLGTALQMINDVLNAPEDHAGGRTTPVLRWVACGATSPLERSGLVGHPAVTRALAIARAAIADAERAARRLELAAVSESVASVRGLIDRTDERLLAHVLGINA